MTLLLPEETHDVSFAMTSSFTCMMYATLVTFSKAGAFDGRVGAIAQAMRRVIQDTRHILQELARHKYERVVYLGSGPFQGLARESTLKLGELTNGAVATCFDTPLGFRHGPKTFVNERTLVVAFVSNDLLARKYDHDLIDELRRDGTRRPRHRSDCAAARCRVPTRCRFPAWPTRTTWSCCGPTSRSPSFMRSTNRVPSGCHPTTQTRKAP